MVWTGEEQAWDLLSGLDPADVQTNAGVTFDHGLSSYILTSFGFDIFISLKNRDIFSTDPVGEFLVKDLGHLSRLSILWYLFNAEDQPLSGRLIKPSDLPGGDIYVKGTHVLPLDELSEEFGNNPEEFINWGTSLGGHQLDYGDASLKLFPFPRIPVVLILWLEDYEFPSSSAFLFDSSCAMHLPVDILWATAMMTIEVMLSIQ